jgi:uracil-DNA glycosylase family 4
MPIIPDLSKLEPPSYAGFDPLVVDCPPTDNITTAELCVIGEAPSTVEVMNKEPFTGPTGAQFNRICNAAGIPRHKLYITNACKAQLPKNNTDKLWTYKGYRHPAWGELQSRLIEELSEFTGSCIVLLGATAMKLLVDEPKFDSITKYAGSVYRAEEFPHLADKLRGKFICLTFHPSSSLPRNNPKNFYIIIAHMRKFMALTSEPELYLPQPEIKTRPILNDVLEFYAELKQSSEVTFDIESTPRYISCFSLSCKPTFAMSIPLMDNSGNYWTLEEEEQIWTGLAEILADPDIAIVCQNGMFDIMFVLRTMNIISDNFSFDTMLAQHVCYADLPKGLDFLTAAYTYWPYYKDDGKQSHLAAIKDWDSYWIYNGKDAAYLHTIKKALVHELETFEATDALTYMMELHKPLMEMEHKGLLLDTVGLVRERASLNRKIRALQRGLNKIAGQELNINSSKQLIAYFYGKLQIKPYISRGSGNPTCDTVALSRIAKRGAKGSLEAKMIRKIRTYGKLVSTYFNVPFDADNRLRCSHKIAGTISGRISTEKTFFGTGANLQNQPPAFKKYIIPDADYILVEPDLAKAEAHCVAYLCQDANMIEAFESGIDVHTYNASKIFDIPLEDVTKAQRNMGKRVVHASNYSMGPITFSDNLASDDIFMSVGECKTLLNAYHARFPGLHRWHEQIRYEINNTRVLHNMFGRPKRFLGLLDDNLYRSAYSYIPQSTVAELLNRGLIKIANDQRLATTLPIELLTTVHDSIMFQVHKDYWGKLHLILGIIKDHLTHTFYHKGRSFTIGVDAKMGFQWSGNTAELKDFSQETIALGFEKLGIDLDSQE